MLHPFNRIFGMGEKPNKNEEDVLYHPDEVIQLPVDSITPNQFQPRSVFNEKKINELAQTIHTHGMIQPIIVRKSGEEGYELIAGERRWRAVVSLGWESISAIIRDMSDTETASVALIENLQREELTVIEEANAYAQLINIHSLTQEALAQRLGKSQSTIANKLRLLKLPEIVKQALLNKDITERHARALIKLKDSDIQEKLLEQVINNDLNVRQTEEKIEKLMAPVSDVEKKRPKFKGVSKDIRIAMNTIRQSLDMVSETGIEVKSDEEDHEDYYKFTIRIPKTK